MEEVWVDQHHLGDWVTSTKNKYDAKKDFIAQKVAEEIPGGSEEQYSDGFEE